jgi:hypothetical protein
VLHRTDDASCASTITKNELQVNDFVKDSFEKKNSEKKWKMGKLFFGVRDPRKVTPSKKTDPNWKMDPSGLDAKCN